MGFEASHPAVNLLFFAAVIFGTLTFDHPVFLLISLLGAAAYSIRRNGKAAVRFDLCLIPAALLLGLCYSSTHHFGMTVLHQNFIGNNITLESLAYGCVVGFACAGFVMWMSCVYSVFSSDKAVHLFGRISPRLSLFLTIGLRMIPRIKGEARRINEARCAIGKGAGQGTALQRIGHGLRIFSMLISWGIGSLGAASDSMRSRGSGLRGRTAFSIYRFDNRDRALVVWLFGCITMTAVAALTGQTRLSYTPRILWQPMTGRSFLFAAFYGLLCLLPLGLELYQEFCFHRAGRKL